MMTTVLLPPRTRQTRQSTIVGHTFLSFFFYTSPHHITSHRITSRSFNLQLDGPSPKLIKREFISIKLDLIQRNSTQPVQEFRSPGPHQKSYRQLFLQHVAYLYMYMYLRQQPASQFNSTRLDPPISPGLEYITKFRGVHGILHREKVNLNRLVV